MSAVIDIDEGQELTIRCKQNRHFDLEIDLGRDLTGLTFKMQVRDVADTVLLTFEGGQGLTVTGTKISLAKTAAQMALPAGPHMYDLVQIGAGRSENVFFGTFLVVPSVTLL